MTYAKTVRRCADEGSGAPVSERERPSKRPRGIEAGAGLRRADGAAGRAGSGESEGTRRGGVTIWAAGGGARGRSRMASRRAAGNWLGPDNSASAPNRGHVRETHVGRAGIETSPSLSPDGKWIVYASGGGQRNIQLQAIGGQVPIDLTKDEPAADGPNPRFRPMASSSRFNQRAAVGASSSWAGPVSPCAV